MRSIFGIVSTAVLFSLFVSCAFDREGVELSVVLPEVPAFWLEVLGEPEWSYVWYGPDGLRQELDPQADVPALDLPNATAVPVLAFPCWPELGIAPGAAKPAGAIHPFAAADGELRLTWRGGVSARFYAAMLELPGQRRYAPHFFDWPRFAELLESEELDADFLADPWRADWLSIAARTRASGFDRRRLVPRPLDPVVLDFPSSGPWIASSPFAAGPLETGAGRRPWFASEEPDALLCGGGCLRFSSTAAAWFPANLLADSPSIR